MDRDTETDQIEMMFEERFCHRHHDEIVASLPGVDAILAILVAEFLAATGGDWTGSDSVDRLDSTAGFVPIAGDWARIMASLKRSRRHDQCFLRTSYLAAQTAIRTDLASRAYDNRKCVEINTHTQGVLTLSRLVVPWTKHTVHHPTAPDTAASSYEILDLS